MRISELCKMEQRYNVVFMPRQQLLDELWNKYIDLQEHSESKSKTLSEKNEITSSRNKKDLSRHEIIPDERYVKRLISDLSDIENALGKYEYSKLKSGLQEILNNGDFEDAEEIMMDVHELIKKHVYGSDSKVDFSEWKVLEQYIRKAGYIAVSIQPGDSIEPFKTYFDRAIGADGGKKNTIKQIQLSPYTISYFDGEQSSDLKLCGKCTYYKG